MPWQETCPLQERERFIREYLRRVDPLTELCLRFGVSRKTAYKWIGRFSEHGREGLKDRPHDALTHPNAISLRMEKAICAAKLKHPRLGPKKLVGFVARAVPEEPCPAVSTIGEVLFRAGLTKPRKRVHRTPLWPSPLVHAVEPNLVWSVDFKGWFRTNNGVRCDPFTTTDAFSRFILGIQVVRRPDANHVKPAMERLFREYGLPVAVRSDNGPPFATRGVAGLSRLSIWWVRLGIRPERIQPGRPDQNGRHERMHRTLGEETASPPAANATAQQRAFDYFRQSFNEVRPHEALGQKPPATVYRPSPRPYPDRLPDLEYAGHFELRRVRPNGEIKWANGLIYVGETLAGETVGLEPFDDRYWRLAFGPISLGYVDGYLRKRVNLVEV